MGGTFTVRWGTGWLSRCTACKNKKIKTSLDNEKLIVYNCKQMFEKYENSIKQITSDVKWKLEKIFKEVLIGKRCGERCDVFSRIDPISL